VTVTTLLLTLLALAVWELNEIRKYMAYVRELWINHYQLNRANLDFRLPDDAPDPDNEKFQRSGNFNYKAAHEKLVKTKLDRPMEGGAPSGHR